ncbi:hypothetical protein ACIQXD_35295 [Streptomyces uncialis]|uniref:DUF7691 family protein n=1 Tax=Streptomyces uncialis TaxID=1048205 RepID=UPI0037F5B076
MSHDIEYSTADSKHALAYLGSGGGGLTDRQEDNLEFMRSIARGSQRGLDAQGIDWGVTIPDALEHLVAGRTDYSGAPYAGCAYVRALQIVIGRTGSDPVQMGTYSAPATFFGLMDEDMQRLGVPAHLLPHRFLYGGPPVEFPVLPCPPDGYPAIGHLPLAHAKPAADAYRTVLHRMDPDYQADAQELITLLDDEHEEWEDATKRLDWYTADSLFFQLT